MKNMIAEFKAFIDKGVVSSKQLMHRAIFPQHISEQHFSFFAKGLAQVVIKIRKH